MSISTAEFEKALKSLEEVLGMDKTDVVRDASIQRFEYCVELSWKTAKKITGTSSSAPKVVIREMAQQGLIDDPVVWIKFIEARNKSSHTYRKEVAEEVYSEACIFLPKAMKMLEKLKGLE